MIALDGIVVRYGATEALSGVSLRVERGALCTLVGPSGCGKTTLLRLVNRLVAPDEGTVRVRDKDVAAADAAALETRLGSFDVPSQLPQMIPYLATLIALVIYAWRGRLKAT